jgi:hypothetical protein
VDDGVSFGVPEVRGAVEAAVSASRSSVAESSGGWHRSLRTMKRLVAWLLLLAPGCTCGAPGAVSTAPSSTPLPAASAHMASTSTPTPGPAADCDLRWGYHGTIVGEEVYLRLERTGSALAGRYFYAKMGVDLALAGTIDASHRIDLVEGHPNKPTGHFRGTCDVARGVLDGTWSNGKGSHAFHLERVGPRESPLVTVKRRKLTRKPKEIGPLGMKACSYDQETVELFGAGSPEAERALDRQGATDLVPPDLTEGEYDEVERCETGLDASYGERVIGAFRGLVTLERGGSAMLDGAAHPNNGQGWERVTYDLSTGKAVTEGDLYAKFPEALVKRCIAAYGGEKELFQTYMDGHLFALGPEGVHVFGAGYPHFASALTGQGPILTWAALLREGALRADSPARRAWEGVAPAKRGDPECLTDDEGRKPINTSPTAR